MRLFRYTATLMLLFSVTLCTPTLSWGFNGNPIEGLHQDIQSEMETAEPQFLPDVEILWRGMLHRSPTLQLALQKMAEKTGSVKPKDKSIWTQGMLGNLIQLGGIGGAVLTASPAPLVGSTMAARATRPDTSTQRLTTITSADLVILAKEIETAQSHLLQEYLTYRDAREQHQYAQTGLIALQSQALVLPQGHTPTLDVLKTLVVHQSLELEQAQSNVDTARNLLVLSAGDEAVSEVDKHLAAPPSISPAVAPADSTTPTSSALTPTMLPGQSTP